MGGGKVQFSSLVLWTGDVIPALFRIAFRRLIRLSSALVYSVIVCDTITEQEMISLQDYRLLNRGHFHFYCHSMLCDDSNSYVNVFDSVKICCPSSNTIRLQETFLYSNRMRWKNFSVIECKASTEVILCPNSIRWKNSSVIECKASTEGCCNRIAYAKRKPYAKWWQENCHPWPGEMWNHTLSHDSSPITASIVESLINYYSPRKIIIPVSWLLVVIGLYTCNTCPAPYTHVHDIY